MLKVKHNKTPKEVRVSSYKQKKISQLKVNMEKHIIEVVAAVDDS